MSTTELFVRGFVALACILLFGCALIASGLGLVAPLEGVALIVGAVAALVFVTRGYE